MPDQDSDPAAPWDHQTQELSATGSVPSCVAHVVALAHLGTAQSEPAGHCTRLERVHGSQPTEAGPPDRVPPGEVQHLAPSALPAPAALDVPRVKKLATPLCKGLGSSGLVCCFRTTAAEVTGPDLDPLLCPPPGVWLASSPIPHCQVRPGSTYRHSNASHHLGTQTSTEARELPSAEAALG